MCESFGAPPAVSQGRSLPLADNPDGLGVAWREGSRRIRRRQSLPKSHESELGPGCRAQGRRPGTSRALTSATRVTRSGLI